MLNDVRGWAKGTLPTYQDRKAFFEGIVNGDPDPIALLRAGDEAAVRDLIAAAQRAHTPAVAPDVHAHRGPHRLHVRLAPRGRGPVGPALAALAEDAGCDVVAMEVVPDDFALIEDRLHHFVDDGCDLIFTTGGTGLTPDDVTPEATRAVIDARGARLRRGDARRGRPGTRRTGMLIARGLGHRGHDADRQLPGLAEGGRASCFPVHRADAAPTRCAPCAGDSPRHGARD